jgi:hypothetical protein
MSTADQLHMRALRILNDGRPHDTQAIRWARVTASPELRRLAADQPLMNWQALRSAGFTLREISLGAQ